MKKLLFTMMCMFAGIATAQNVPTEDLYGTGTWDCDSLGNHRAVVSVEKQADAVMASLNWRRRDTNVDQKGVFIIDATTGKQVTNVARFTYNREKGEIVFQPQTVPGKYYIYYLNCRNTAKSWWYPNMTYLPFKDTADPAWLKKNKLTGKTAPKLPVATLVQYQSIDEFNSFYPMEIIATEAETEAVRKANADGKYILFTEDRKFPIRMTSDIPYRWAKEGKHTTFDGTADKGEYYCFQFGVWAVRGDVNNIRLTYTALVNEKTGEEIPASSFNCINTDGIDVTGTVFEKECSVKQGKIQPLWIGTMVPELLSAGTYKGKVTLTADNAESRTVEVTLNVTDNVIANHGDDEPWRHSRLRWLNSQIGFDDEVVAPYTPVKLHGKNLSILGREIKLAESGLPASIESYFEETLTKIGTTPRNILAKPMTLQADGGEWQNLDFAITKRKPGAVAWKTTNQNSNFIMQLDGEMESDGAMTYKVVLIAKEDAEINDIALQTTLTPGLAKYMMGLGLKGGYSPKDFSWKWDVAKKNQDAIWAGDVNAGLQLRFYDDKYDRPLNTNFYLQKPLILPASWGNNGNGGLTVTNEADGSLIKTYSGKRTVKKGDRLHYYFTILITPFRTINTNKQWHDRYYHRYDFVDNITKYGATVVNVHHANAINPYINYPFLRPQQMKAYADAVHAEGMKLKIYNTVRELTNHAPEVHALFSLGNEIFSEGKGGGYSWLQEHLDQNYIAAWFSKNTSCAAIVNTGVSRWHNFYMEGLDYLVKNIGIDGLYIDDLAFDRMSMKRIRKILTRTNPGALIDLHSANQYNPKDGFVNSATLYMEHFPYLDRLWFGEYFDYNNSPDFYLTEVSGIPFGLMGEMLQDGGNKWRGLLYGMTARMPWSEGIDNRPIWKLWDSFGMKDSEMIGYWVSYNPVKTNSEKTLATIYRHYGEKTLISIATWNKGGEKIKLDIDFAALGLDASKVKLHAPKVDLFQDEQTWNPGDEIMVPEGKGLLIVVE
ncbi:MAG: DUF6067 family protein [Bacteroidales bacterium]|nr:DUF6067 family protein [Bacteroidales bacterium]